ncbi:hypothetical protein J7K06_06875 [Candidatus Bathyarchaeota archaeon]|nr:hypothetical protein [Candidatus Bathyarchaeota archaeon]
MSMDKIEIAGLILVITAITLVFVFILENSFPAFILAENHWKPVEISGRAGAETAYFMWNYRSLDLIAQVSALFGAAVGCLAILRKEKEGRK